MKNAALWFVALIPPEPVAGEIQNFKLEASKKYNSARALRSPAHITLFPPFRASHVTIDHCERRLREVSQLHNPFVLEIDGFAAFKPRVIFVKPILNPELAAIQVDVENAIVSIVDTAERSNKQFNPHFTIAFRDLARDMFGPAWKYFSNITYKRKVVMRDMVILKHYAEGWKIHSTIPFSHDRESTKDGF